MSLPVYYVRTPQAMENILQIPYQNVETNMPEIIICI
jgi:hypothetical protein